MCCVFVLCCACFVFRVDCLCVGAVSFSVYLCVCFVRVVLCCLFVVADVV